MTNIAHLELPLGEVGMCTQISCWISEKVHSSATEKTYIKKIIHRKLSKE